MVEVLQAMKIMQIPFDRGLFAVDLERIQRFVTTGITCGLEKSEGPVGKVAEEGTGVVDAHFLYFARQVVLALLDKRFRHRRDVADGTIKPHGGVDTVRQKIPRDAAACS